MGYLIKSNVINALEEDMHDTMMCYEGKREKDIIAFCYESMEQTIEKSPQYWPDNVVENAGLTQAEIQKLKERDTAKEIQKVDEQPYFRKHFHSYICPVCHKKVEFGWLFCGHCGQKLKRKD